MQPSRQNPNEMDMSGRSVGSAASMNSYRMMEQQQQRFPSGPAYNQNYGPQSPQQQQRFFQMQMHQQQMQAQQMQMRQNPQMAQQQHLQQQQQMQHQRHDERRNSLNSLGSQQSAPSKPTMPPPAQPVAKSAAAPSNVPQKQASPPKQASPTAAAATSTAASANATDDPKPKAKPRPPHIPQPTMKEAQKLLPHCDWVDKTLWVSRQVFGGNSHNLFLGSTAQVQKVKKNRARHFTKAAKAAGEEPKTDDELKGEIMNARTAKRMKTEMESGMEFCEAVHGTIRDILKEMCPLFEPPPALTMDLPDPKAKMSLPRAQVPLAQKQPTKPTSRPKVATKTTASPGNANGSTLRKNRKKKLPPSDQPAIKLSEYDESGKKKYSKKEHLHRLVEATRFRALRRDDFVAARVSSRDLWILARVLKKHDGFKMSPASFLKLTEAKRDHLFREKVLLKDVEEKAEDTSVQVERKLVLPLPRNFSEAAEWAQRAKKGSRVYAMYPNTTSLYSATVVDNTTYCRQEDDIVVVEFDGDEPDESGAVPKCHIPARFVTLIPREFAAAPPAAGGGNSKKRKSIDSATSASSVQQSAAAAMLNDPLNGMDMLDDMNFDDALPGLDGFDDLDFDLLGG